MPLGPALVVFSHLRWNFVFQRPQQLLSRLSRNRPVFFIEEPVYQEGSQPHWELESPCPNLTVCRPHTPVDRPGYSHEQRGVVQPLIEQLIAERGLERYILWFYSPL